MKFKNPPLSFGQLLGSMQFRNINVSLELLIIITSSSSNVSQEVRSGLVEFLAFNELENFRRFPRYSEQKRGSVCLALCVKCVRVDVEKLECS